MGELAKVQKRAVSGSMAPTCVVSEADDGTKTLHMSVPTASIGEANTSPYVRSFSLDEDFSFYFSGLLSGLPAIVNHIKDIETPVDRVQIGQAFLDDFLGVVNDYSPEEESYLAPGLADIAYTIYKAQPSRRSMAQFIAMDLIQRQVNSGSGEYSTNAHSVFIPLYLASKGDVPHYPQENVSGTTEVSTKNSLDIPPSILPALEFLRENCSKLAEGMIEDAVRGHAAQGGDFGLAVDMQENGRKSIQVFLTEDIFGHAYERFEECRTYRPESQYDFPRENMYGVHVSEGYYDRARLLLNEITPDGKLTKQNIQGAYAALKQSLKFNSSHKMARSIKTVLEQKFSFLKAPQPDEGEFTLSGV